MTHVLALRVWGVPMPYVVLLVMYAASRAGWLLAGVRFDASPPGQYWQFLDVELLRTHLPESIWHLHSQPPLFNLLIGLTMTCGGGQAPLLFHLMYLLAGYGICAGIHALLRSFCVDGGWALAGAALFTLSPSALLHEHWLFYPQPVAFLLVAAAVAFRRFQREDSPRHAIAVLVIVCMLCLMRSTYHITFLVMMAVLLLAAGRRHRRAVALASLLALLVVGGWYAKNLTTFGFFGASSWFGMNLSRIATASVDTRALHAHVAAGEVDSIILVYPFSALDTLGVRDVRDLTQAAPIALHGVWKSNGMTNFNHVAYVDVSKRYLSASLFLIRTHPRAYVDAVGRAWVLFLQPSWERGFFGYNAPVTDWYIRIWWAYREVAARLLRLLVDADASMLVHRARASTGAALVLFLFVVSTFIGFMRHRSGSDDSRMFGFAMVLLVVLFVGIVVNAIELGENNRFKYEVEPLLYVLAIVALHDHVGRLRDMITSRRKGRLLA